MQSKKPNNPLEDAYAPTENVSVYDFLYYDYTRISSFLAQFESGHITQVTKSESATRSSKDTLHSELAGTAKVVSGKMEDNSEVSKEATHQSSKVYDTRWENALAFLDYLEANELLSPEIETARIGRIVLVMGDLTIFDLNILQRMWSLSAIKKTILAGARSQSEEASQHHNRQERRKASASNKKSTSNGISEAELALELLTVLPHAVQAAVSTKDLSAWCTLREDSITVSPSDLFMKHGLTISGQWAMVGILDALPDNDAALSEDGSLEMARQMIAGAKLGAAGYMIAPHLVGPVRTLLGRPSSSYGITPLLIFRNVSSQYEDGDTGSEG
ncbi:hypothetical protein [Rhizobium sp. WW_1]|uniref:DUF6414 family protein n=1 Tax=Rhizobium sp. WW_1 TaxID=1907375 RepID=UPI000645F476|nr:hypothetical protein [Rhizobium sp. WW_1]RKD61579.1 hypothetical protein BJ928_107180 [Rhizobium sp. WW_1]